MKRIPKGTVLHRGEGGFLYLCKIGGPVLFVCVPFNIYYDQPCLKPTN